MFRPVESLLVAIAAGLFGVASATAEENTNIITGAGAHFSWVVVDGQKQALEKHINRPIKLFGREQMLGAGCNAGIKIAQSNRPGHETFGLVCCQIDTQEAAEKSLKVFPIAEEPILILVNAGNPVRDLSVQQVRDLFSGKIRNWKQVGGNNEPVVVFMRPHCEHRPGHWKTILPELEYFSKDKVKVQSAVDMVQRISDFTGGIGHTGSAWEFDPDSRVKAVTVSGIKPTAANLKRKRYPFYRTLSAVTNETPSAEVISLIEYARTSEEFRQIAAQYQLQPLKRR